MAVFTECTHRVIEQCTEDLPSLGESQQALPPSMEVREAIGVGE